MRLCSYPGCEQIHDAKGYCSNHYRRQKKYGSPENRNFMSPDGLCSFEGCNRKHATKGLCETHRSQRDRGKELGPPIERDFHGHSRIASNQHRSSITYNSWRSMKIRCDNPKHPNYEYYGGRGITICQGWKDSFVTFLDDMGERPEGTSIDRIDNDGNYSCGHCEECIKNGWESNCRWATQSEQNLNQRKRKTNKGETMSTLVENIDKEIKEAKVQVKELQKDIKALEQAKIALQARKKTSKKITKPRRKKDETVRATAEQIQTSLRDFVSSDA